jgi:hypothetical protein
MDTCNPSSTESWGYPEEGRAPAALAAGSRWRLAVGAWTSRWHAVAIAGLLLAALLLRVDGISTPSLATRELHNALLAREYYLPGTGLPGWKEHVLQALHQSVQPVEPPVLDHLAAWGYQLTGGEHLWLPRLISALFWILGGWFLYRLALRVTNRQSALVSLALYLFWPYGVLISRLYMPDPMMVALLVGGALAIVRYWEEPSRGRLAAAAAVSALATAAKPGMALPFLIALFLALAASHRTLRHTLVRGRLLAFSALAAAPTGAYYVYGTYARHFLSSEGDASHRIQIDVIASGAFWRGWWHQLATILAFPQPQLGLAVIPLGAGMAGLLVDRARVGRSILVGLGVGYVIYALALAGYTEDNAYYALPVIPILALAIGRLLGAVIERERLTKPMASAAMIALCLVVVAVGTYKSQPSPANQTAISDYRRIGEITHHTTGALIVDPELRTPAMYWGWIVGKAWYQPTAGQDLPATGNPFPVWVDPAQVGYLVIMDVSELRSEPRLRSMIRGLAVLARTARYAVFDARGGRLARYSDRGSTS